jgi:hypothetical protein
MDEELQGKMQELFGIPNKLIPRLKYQCNQLMKGQQVSIYEDIHKMIIDLFNTDYYPLISRNIKIDDNNVAIIMGGVSYNMNIPAKMGFLRLDTDDFDLKIYTSSISYLDKERGSLLKVLSVFKFSVLVICMYLKQVFKYMSTFNECNTAECRHTKYYGKANGKAIGKGEKKTKKHKYNKKHGGGESVGGGEQKTLIKKYELTLQIKKKDSRLKMFEVIDTIDITKLSYTELYSRVIDVINDPELMATNKITYETGKGNKMRALTFGDSKIIYAGLETPAFFAQYLEANPTEVNKTLNQLINMHLPITKIMELKPCANNCRFMSIKSLLIDTILMLSYADLLAYEKLESGGEVLVPAGFIFKYYKYLVKFIRLMVMKKFYSGTLKGKFFENAKSLWQYALTDLRRQTAQLRPFLDEYDKINIVYKNFLNDFHQNLFHNRSILLNKYPELAEIANEYQRVVFFINKSRNLFRELNEKSLSSPISSNTIESVAIQYAEKELSKQDAMSKTFLEDSSIISKSNSKNKVSQKGAAYKSNTNNKNNKNNKINKKNKKRAGITLIGDNYSYGDIELNNVKTDKIRARKITNKIRKMLSNEVELYSSLALNKSIKSSS